MPAKKSKSDKDKNWASSSAYPKIPFKQGSLTSASGTPGPAGVLTTGHYSKNGQRMYGGYSASSGKAHINFKKGRSKSPSKVDKYTPARPYSEVSDSRRRRLPGAR